MTTTTRTVRDASDAWLKRCKREELDTQTIKTYRCQVETHILPRLGDVELADLRRAGVVEFMEDMLDANTREMTRKVMVSLKSLLKVAVEREWIATTRSNSLWAGAFLNRNLTPGTTAQTDAWSAYPGAPGVIHQPYTIGPMAAHIVLPWIHRVFANLKAWSVGVYHGLRRRHLQAYLDEFVCRFNRRYARHAAFRRLLGLGTKLEPITYNMLVKPEAGA